ncbi:MAG: hypothetical protein ACTSXO_07075 [Candidatus Heimdallarchaeota archaeon]
MQIFPKNRIMLQFPGANLHLDPKFFNSKEDRFFISHAHYDHLPIRGKKPPFVPKVVCSNATAKLFNKRIGYEITPLEAFETEQFSLKAIPSGHTFDSTVAEIKLKENGLKVLYTGDINVEDRAYLQGFRPKKCDILLLEATWGHKEYSFPPFEEQVEQATNYIQTQLDHNHPVILLGYAIGKAQLLNYCFGQLTDLRFSSKIVWEMEQIHKELGLSLYPTKKLPTVIDDLPKTSPWLLFQAPSPYNSNFIQKLKKKTNCRVVGFSGWAKDLESFKHRSGADAAFMISDHSDYNKLLELAKACSPEKIFTIFGNAKKLAKDLQKEGLNALPLSSGQSTLENYL